MSAGRRVAAATRDAHAARRSLMALDEALTAGQRSMLLRAIIPVFDALDALPYVPDADVIIAWLPPLYVRIDEDERDAWGAALREELLPWPMIADVEMRFGGMGSLRTMRERHDRNDSPTHMHERVASAARRGRRRSPAPSRPHRRERGSSLRTLSMQRCGSERMRLNPLWFREERPMARRTQRRAAQRRRWTRTPRIDALTWLFPALLIISALPGGAFAHFFLYRPAGSSCGMTTAPTARVSRRSPVACMSNRRLHGNQTIIPCDEDAMTPIEAVSNGLGAQSMRMLVLAVRKTVNPHALVRSRTHRCAHHARRRCVRSFFAVIRGGEPRSPCRSHQTCAPDAFGDAMDDAHGTMDVVRLQTIDAAPRSPSSERSMTPSLHTCERSELVRMWRLSIVRSGWSFQACRCGPPTMCSDTRS
ncbi:MAG: hypothetical protein NZ701_09980, partial [Roseiflexus sp.]|nr:hypothetical protein [Roseiflexus sp.]